MVIEVSCATLVCDFQVVFIFISHDLNALLRRNTNLKLNAFFFTWELVGRLWRSESESLGLCKIRAFIRWNDEWGHGMNLKAFRIFGRSQSQNLRIMLRQCEQQNYSQQICGCLNIYTDTFIDFPQYLAVSISRLYFGARSFGCCFFFEVFLLYCQVHLFDVAQNKQIRVYKDSMGPWGGFTRWCPIWKLDPGVPNLPHLVLMHATCFCEFVYFSSSIC